MIRFISIIICLVFLQGCTVGWYSLRESKTNTGIEEKSAWSCPVNFKLTATSSLYTNSFGKKEARPEYISKLEEQFTSVTENTLKDLGCQLNRNSNNLNEKTLIVMITQQKYLSALPQEWLTGLSFGIIPSWGTRPEQRKFEFKKGNYTRIFVVDDTRVNHLILSPFFWLTLPLMNIESEYEKALRDYAKNY